MVFFDHLLKILLKEKGKRVINQMIVPKSIPDNGIADRQKK